MNHLVPTRRPAVLVRAVTNPAPRRWVTGAAVTKHRASTPTTLATERSAKCAASASVAAVKPAASPSSGVMSLNVTPGFGKSGTSRISEAISSTARTYRRSVGTEDLWARRHGMRALAPTDLGVRGLVGAP